MSARSFTIDLLPKHVVEERRVTRFLNWSLTYGRYIIVATELVVLLAFFSRFRLDQELTDLHESINQKQEIIMSVSEFEDQVRKLQRRIEKIGKLNKHHTLYIDTLRLLEDIVPTDIILTKLEARENKLILSATAYSKTGFSRLVQNLKRSSKIRELNIEKISKSEDTDGLLTFTMSFKLVPQSFSQ